MSACDSADESTAMSRNSIAIVSMACRFPGGVRSPEDLWRLTMAGGDAISLLPTDRGWDIESLLGTGTGEALSCTDKGGFLYDAGGFDPTFFGISPREALAMDPQQRLLLETSWEAFERAGILPVSLRGSDTGVFIGMTNGEYGPPARNAPRDFHGHIVTGSLSSMGSGRLAYVFGLHGPAMTIDTACSASHVAIHLACRSLRDGECSLALVGGVSVMSTPDYFIEMDRLGALARDGRCKPFSDTADGMGLGEGAGVLLLERLADATANNRPVLAVVRGSAVNSDGVSPTLTAPNGTAQQQVIRRALADAGISADEVDAVEAHGTGTRAGDTIEAQALLATYGRARSADNPLWVGSVKSNIAHPATAAGVAGVIKMVQEMQHGVLARITHLNSLTRLVDWSTGTVRPLTKTTPWPENDRPRRFAISGFGISGTNAHLIIEQAPARTPTGTLPHGNVKNTPTAFSCPTSRPVPWVISAKTPSALRSHARNLARYAETHPEIPLPDIGLSLATTRSAFRHRAAVAGANRSGMLRALEALAHGRPDNDVLLGSALDEPRIVFVFPGQGAQWPGMGRVLLDTSSVFRQHVERCAQAFEPLVDWSLIDVLSGMSEPDVAARVDVVQTALFAMTTSLAALWRSHDVEPAAVIGHSQGEIAAAYVSGHLSLVDAARLVAARGKALQRLSGLGGMATIPLSRQEVRSRLRRWGTQLSLAAVNGPHLTVVSGPATALKEVLDRFRNEGIEARRVPVDFASHSPQVEPLRSCLVAVAADITPNPGGTPWYSTVSGLPVDRASLDTEYWYRNLRQTVEFHSTVNMLFAEGYNCFIEISPHPVLTAGIEEAAADHARDVAVITTLHRTAGDRFCRSLAEAHVHGVDIRWESVFADVGGRRAALPTYPFQTKRYWLDSPASIHTELSRFGLQPVGHPLLSVVTNLPDTGAELFSGRISIQTHRWLADHRVMGSILLPGTGFLEIALLVGAQVACGRVEVLTMEAPLVIPEQGEVDIRVMTEAADQFGCRRMSVYSRPAAPGNDRPWKRHVTGVLAPVRPTPVTDVVTGPTAEARPVPLEHLRKVLAASGIEHGPAFRGLRSVWQQPDGIYAELEAPTNIAREVLAFGLHPALLDSALQSMAARDAAAYSVSHQRQAAPNVPFVFRGVTRYSTGASTVRTRLRYAGADAMQIVVADLAGQPILSIESLELTPMTSDQLRGGISRELRPSLFGLQWQPRTTGSADRPPKTYAVIGVEHSALSGALRASGCTVDQHKDLADLGMEVDSGRTAPDTVILLCTTRSDGESLTEQVYAETCRVLSALQNWVDDGRFATSRLVIVTCGAVAVNVGDSVPDLTHAAVWGLVRSAQTEHPDQIAIIDTDATEASWSALPTAFAADSSQLAVRNGTILLPQLNDLALDRGLSPPRGPVPWRLTVTENQGIGGLALRPCPEAAEPLLPRQIRVAVRASSLNFRDALLALGMLPDMTDTLGSDAAGVVVEVGAAVDSLVIGDRVMGLIPGCLGPIAVTDHAMVARIPDGWGFTEAAAVPAVYLTAYYALVDLADLKPGETVLIHAATGGVGTAAVQLAKHLGARVFATASPGKWELLRSWGLEDERICSSRTLDFEKHFLDVTEGHGMDVVLNCLAGQFVDASLRMLTRGGRFLEMGKTDIRDPEQVAAEHPGVVYRAFDLIDDTGPDRIRRMLADLMDLFERGALRLPGIAIRDIRRAPAAVEHLAHARHTGKIVLTIPSTLDTRGTVLITGGTGVLGGLIARHLVTEYGIRHLMLISRSGRRAPGAADLEAELCNLGADVTIASCDAADSAALSAVLATISTDHPLTGIVHAAGVIDDAVLSSITPQRLESVLRPKVDAAINLDRLTHHADLSMFVLFSSAAGILGTGGQASYAAANTFLDALAHHRRARGLAAVSLAWGLWAPPSSMTSHLDRKDLVRIRRLGITGLTIEAGLDLFDRALATDHVTLAPMQFDPTEAVRLAATHARPSTYGTYQPKNQFLTEMVADIKSNLAGKDSDTQVGILMQVVRDHAAIVLAHNSADDIEPTRSLFELGLDSLTAVELCSRLKTVTGLRLPLSVIFKHRTAAGLAQHLRSEMVDTWTEAPRVGTPADVLDRNSVSEDPIVVRPRIE